MQYSILSRYAKVNVCFEPFLHVVIDDALSGTLLSHLESAFTDLENCFQHNNSPNNTLFLRRASEYLPVSPDFHGLMSGNLVLKFLRYHLSSSFLTQVLSLFSSSICHSTPFLGIDITPGSPVPCFPRYLRKHSLLNSLNPAEDHFLLDVQLCLNTPVTIPDTTVIRPHIDDRNKFFNALLYLRPDHDDLPGGDLCLHESLNRWETKAGDKVESRDIWQPSNNKIVKTIEYRKNRLVLFFNSNSSVHSVSTRPVTPFMRRYINFTCDYSRNFFTSASPYFT